MDSNGLLSTTDDFRRRIIHQEERTNDRPYSHEFLCYQSYCGSNIVKLWRSSLTRGASRGCTPQLALTTHLLSSSAHQHSIRKYHVEQCVRWYDSNDHFTSQPDGRNFVVVSLEVANHTAINGCVAPIPPSCIWTESPETIPPYNDFKDSSSRKVPVMPELD